MSDRSPFVIVWGWAALIFWIVILACFLSGCATMSPREAQLQAIKDKVDGSMTYQYCKGWDCPANCAAFAKAYKREADAAGVKGYINSCILQNGTGHAWFQTYQGEVLDVRRFYISDYDSVGCR